MSNFQYFSLSSLIFIFCLNLCLCAEPKVAIIGAGVAGLSAANKLLEKGFQNFVIFEAENRIGGRVFPIKYKDGYLQMGAQYINGNRNPLYQLAVKLGILDNEYSDDDLVYRYGNCPIKESDLEAFEEFVDPLEDSYTHTAENNEQRSYVETVKSMYDKDYANFLKIQNASTGYRRQIFDSLTQKYRSGIEFEYAAKWDDLSLRSLVEWDDLDPSGRSIEYATNKIGYTAIISHLASKIPSSKLYLNHRIANINFVGEKTRLLLANGTLINDAFDYVIVTSAIGHLKKFARQMFTPQLPAQKLQAINKIGFGKNEKIFVEYSETSWADSILTPLLIPGCSSSRSGISNIESEFFVFQKLSWAPNMLMGWIAGDGVSKVDAISDKELGQILTNLFRDIYQNYSIPLPLAIIRQKWSQNDLFGGSYSYVSFEQAQARIRHSDMAIPVMRNGKIRIQFAGEATHQNHFQTAIGAFLSGARESDRILNNIRNFRSS